MFSSEIVWRLCVLSIKCNFMEIIQKYAKKYGGGN